MTSFKDYEKSGGSEELDFRFCVKLIEVDFCRFSMHPFNVVAAEPKHHFVRGETFQFFSLLIAISVNKVYIL